jgi:hypothetical protein
MVSPLSLANGVPSKVSGPRSFRAQTSAIKARFEGRGSDQLTSQTQRVPPPQESTRSPVASNIAPPTKCSKGVEKGGELARGVKALSGEVLPAFFGEDAAVELVVPEDIEGLALGVVVDAGQADEGRLGRRCGGYDFFDQPAP